MALTSTTTFDIVGATQTITFNNPTQVDQITYSGNQIIFQTSSAYNLAKSDYLLYFKYLNAFNNLLLLNFPVISQAFSIAWPLCQFDITESNVGVQKIIYSQSSVGTAVININYVPIANSSAFTARASPVTISLQEFFMMVYMLSQYTNQVGLN